MRLTQISHLLTELNITTLPHVYSNSQSVIASVKNRIYCADAVAQIVTKFYLAAGMARNGGINLSYVRNAEMRADCFTKPLLKPAILKQCAAMGMVWIGLGTGLGNVLRIGFGNDPGYGPANMYWNWIWHRECRLTVS